jgi:hypothetical protein
MRTGRMKNSMVKRAAFWIMSIAITEPAVANEVSNFTYDELGRLIGVTKTGTINNGQAVLVQYDPAGNRQGYAVGGVGGNANLPGLSISDPTVMEGAGAQLVFVITLSAPVATAVTVNFATSDGTAIAGQDYVSKSGYLIFSPGETSKSVAVDVINDGILEPDENLSVDISNSSAAYIAKSKGVGTIKENQSAKISISSSVSNEGSPLIFSVTRSSNTQSSVSISWSTSNGTAQSGVNYQAASGILNFPSGATTATVAVQTTRDFVPTSDLYMSVNLSSPSPGAEIYTGSATGTINNIDYSYNPSGSYSLVAGSAVDENSGEEIARGYSETVIGNSIYPYYGSLSGKSFASGYEIVGIDQPTGGGLYLSIYHNGSAPPDGGWTSITVPGVGVLYRSSAVYSTYNGNIGRWYWATATSQIQSGNVIIQ